MADSFDEAFQKQLHKVQQRSLATKKSIVLVGDSSECMTSIARQINTIFQIRNRGISKRTTRSEIEHFLGSSSRSSDDSTKKLTVHNGLVNYFYFTEPSLQLGVYCVAPLNGNQVYPVVSHGTVEVYSVILVVNILEIIKNMDKNADGEQLKKSVTDVLLQWKHELKQMDNISSSHSFSVILIGCDAVEYNFKTMRIVDLIQQVLRMIAIEESHKLPASGCVTYLSKMGVDPDRIAQLLGLIIKGESAEMQVRDYSAIFIPTDQDSRDKIATVDDKFEYEYWGNLWNDDSDPVREENEQKKSKVPAKSNKESWRGETERQYQAFLKNQMEEMKKN